MNVLYRAHKHEYGLGGYDLNGDYVSSGMTGIQINFDEYEITKETPKGYWIEDFIIGKKWVSKTARKRFAYPTKQEALEGFIKRSERYASILSDRLNSVQRSIEIAKEMELKT